MTFAVILGTTYFLSHPAVLKAVRSSLVEPAAPVATAVAEPAPVAAAPVDPVVAASPTATPELVAVAAPPAVSTPPPAPAGPSAEKVALNSRIAASQQRAVGKYPDLAVEGSEINLRFVFRYKNLVQENSPRLLDPNWPEQLAEECAAAAGASLKHTSLTRVSGMRH